MAEWKEQTMADWKEILWTGVSEKTMVDCLAEESASLLLLVSLSELRMVEKWVVLLGWISAFQWELSLASDQIEQWPSEPST